MTRQTFQCRLPTKLVAIGAICGSIQRLVRAGKWAGRDLSAASAASRKKEKH